ncbi:MAG TPA: hypothetical protein VHB46_00880 [Burkholderiales bacterium]|nr:hypothetical protein [Burkholderiales bacterium]
MEKQLVLRNAAIGAAAALVLSACAGVQKDPDPTPISPTAVLEVHLASSGLQDAPAFESTTVTYTRANMMRSESKGHGTGAITRFLDMESGARIERLDRKLAWTLDARNKLAEQCPLTGCPVPALKKTPGKIPTATDKSRNPDCRLRSGNTSVTIEPTGQKRNINGFEAEQYDVKWVSTFRDNASRRSTSTIALDVWATPGTTDLRDAMALEKAFARARDKLTDTDTESDRSAFFPVEAGKVIGAYLAPNVSPTDRAAFLAGARKLEKIKGQPVLVTLQWRFSGEACGMNEAAATEATKDADDRPLLTFTSEVKMHRTEARHDSLFVPPKDYKITK